MAYIGSHPAKGTAVFSSGADFELACQPLAFVVDDGCSWCAFQPRKSLCAACKVEGYCSQECQRRAWKGIHRRECSWLQLSEKLSCGAGQITRTARLVMRVLLTLGADAFKRVGSRESSELFGTDLKTFDNWPLARQAVYLSRAAALPAERSPGKLELTKSLVNLYAFWASKSGGPSVSHSAFVACVDVLQTNAFHIPDVGGSVRGLGLYPAASLFNHSCLPSAVYDFVNTCWDLLTPGTTPHSHPVLCISAKNRAAETELTIRYRPPFEDSDSRRWLPDDTYGFTCLCPVCPGATLDFVAAVRNGEACLRCHAAEYIYLANRAGQPIESFAPCTCSARPQPWLGTPREVLCQLKDVFPGSMVAIRVLIDLANSNEPFPDDLAAVFVDRLLLELQFAEFGIDAGAAHMVLSTAESASQAARAIALARLKCLESINPSAILTRKRANCGSGAIVL